MQEQKEKLLALTFDDGPNTEITPQVLDILEEHHIPASFFLISERVTEASMPVARRAWKMGCEINNHSITHRPMGEMTPEEIRREVDGCTETVRAITGQAPRFFRPPFISVSPTLFDTVELTCICGVGFDDWRPPVTAQERIDRILSTVRDGDILLLHDMPGNYASVEAVRTVVPILKQRGFRFVTCGQLFAEKGVTPEKGKLYSHVE